MSKTHGTERNLVIQIVLAKRKQLRKHMDMDNTCEKAKRKLPSQNILNVFTVLVEGKENERNKATEKLLAYLRDQQTADYEGLCDDVKYTINRLVQGLSSDRKFARISYAAALCQLLRAVDEIPSRDVLNCIEEKSKVPSSEERNANLGKAFGLLTLVNSGKVLSSSSGELNHTVKELLNLHGKKSYLRLMCLNGVKQVITQVSHDAFKQSVLPNIENQFSTGWGECSPDSLHLILVSSQHHPVVVKKLLKEHWQDEQLISEKNFPKLTDIVTKSVSQFAIHPVVDQILTVVKEKHLNIGKFWKQVCKHLLVSERRVRVGAKQTLGLYLFQKILPCIDSPIKVKEVMHTDMASTFIQLCSKKTEEGTKGAKKTEDLIEKASSVLMELATVTADSKDAQFQIEMLKCLITSPGSCEFDSLTNTNTLSKITSQLLPEALCEYIEELIKSFRGQTSWIVSDNKSVVLPQWCVKQLCLVCSNTDSCQQLKVLQFLFLHSFFTVKKNNKDIPHCTAVDVEVTEFQRKCASDSFFKALTKLLTKHDKGVPKAANLNQHIDLLYGLSEYVQTLLRANECVELVKAEQESEIVEEWNKLANVISAINKKRDKEEILDGHAFELLFIFFGLQVFEDPQNMQEALLDLHVCYKRSSKRRMSVAKDAGPAWMDVITELLLSMMFKENTSSRVVAKQVMSFLADHVTHTTVQVIVDALEQTSLDSEEGVLGMEDDGNDEDDDEDDDNDRTQIDDDDDDVSDDNSSSSDDDDDDEDSEDSGIEEEQDVVVADKLKDKVRVALGDAAGRSDEEDDDGEDDIEFSDSEMDKLDTVLASAFRSMSKSKKMDRQKTKQLLDFKIRVLDLVEAIVKNHLSPGIAKGFIIPLLGLIEKGMRKPSEESLGTRAQGALRMLLKQKKLQVASEVDKDEVLELLEQLMKCSNKVPVPSFIQDTGNACLYVLKLLLTESGPSPVKTRSKSEHTQKKPAFYKEKVEAILRSAILDLLSHKLGHCQPAFFHMLIVKYPVMFWSCQEDLIGTVKSQTAKVFDRTQAAAFLANMISKELLDSVEAEDWLKFIDSWKSAAALVIREMSVQGKFRKNLLEEVIATCNQIQVTTPDKLVFDEEDLQSLLTMQKKCDKAIRKAINRMTIGMERTNFGGSESKKMSKKRKKDKDELENQSPEKKSKIEDQSILDKTENYATEKSQSNNLPTPDVSHKQKKMKNKKMKKSEHQSTVPGEELVDQSFGNDTLAFSEYEEMNEVLEGESANKSNQQTPGSSKKKRKNKSKGSSSIDTTNEVVTEKEKLVSPSPSQKKAKPSLVSKTGNQSPGNVSNQSKNSPMSGKKKRRRSKQMQQK